MTQPTSDSFATLKQLTRNAKPADSGSFTLEAYRQCYHKIRPHARNLDVCMLASLMHQPKDKMTDLLEFLFPSRVEPTHLRHQKIGLCYFCANKLPAGIREPLCRSCLETLTSIATERTVALKDPSTVLRRPERLSALVPQVPGPAPAIATQDQEETRHWLADFLRDETPLPRGANATTEETAPVLRQYGFRTG